MTSMVSTFIPTKSKAQIKLDFQSQQIGGKSSRSNLMCILMIKMTIISLTQKVRLSRTKRNLSGERFVVQVLTTESEHKDM